MSTQNTLKAKTPQSTELPTHAVATQLNNRLFEMQSAFGYRTNQEMLDCHFGGDVQSMMNAVKTIGLLMKNLQATKVSQPSQRLS